MTVEPCTRTTQQEDILLEHYDFAYFNGRQIIWFQDSDGFDKERAIFSLSGGLFGGCIATPTGLLLGSSLGAISAGPPGACVGGAIGGGTAFVLGGLAGGYVAYKLYPLFKIMHTTETGTFTMKQVEEIFMNHTIQRASDNDLPQAVRTPCGVIYEKKSLLLWLEKSATDPFVGSPLQKSDLIDVDLDAFEASENEVKEILSEKINYMSTHCPELIPGYRALDAYYRMQRNLFFNNNFLNLQQRLEKKELTQEEYQNQVHTALKEHFGQGHTKQ